ncbi:hypothetical protein SKAU_G00191450 [Synaphobranchus kaupii]|uniref:Uncharacterized protein n=1 Tax=Synaphobranchus kaupii TaxID=118154 RepID=A0A9Q1IWX0_SYNKA|nr:hypothetical protein SKAU_G00191450 [Synaphobranchus kaupii]
MNMREQWEPGVMMETGRQSLRWTPQPGSRPVPVSPRPVCLFPRGASAPVPDPTAGVPSSAGPPRPGSRLVPDPHG